MNDKPTLEELRAAMDAQDAELARCFEGMPSNARFDESVIDAIDSVTDWNIAPVASAALPAFFLRA